MKKLAFLTLLAAACGWLPGAAHAQTLTYTEGSTDAGQTLLTARNTGMGSNPLTSISGTLTGNSDADLYCITLTAPATFSASTVGGSNVDTALFLLDSTGRAIATDDDTATTLQSTLPAGNSLYSSLPAGVFYLGVSVSGYEPDNSAGQLLFATYTGGDTTSVRGPVSGLVPNTLADFRANAYFLGDTGAYTITLTGVAPATAPEPSTWAVVLLGLAALGIVASRRRRAGRVG